MCDWLCRIMPRTHVCMHARSPFGAPPRPPESRSALATSTALRIISQVVLALPGNANAMHIRTLADVNWGHHQCRRCEKLAHVINDAPSRYCHTRMPWNLSMRHCYQKAWECAALRKVCANLEVTYAMALLRNIAQVPSYSSVAQLVLPYWRQSLRHM